VGQEEGQLVRQFSDSTATDGAVDLAADDAIAGLERQVEGVRANKADLIEALRDITAKVKERFPDAKFGIVYNGDPEETWELDIYTEAGRRAVLNFVWPLVRAHKDLGIYPDCPILEEDETAGESARDAV
jgi:hypothetical protein